MKYGKSDKGYFVLVGKVGGHKGEMGPGKMNGESMDEESSSEMPEDPLSKYVSPERHVSFSEAGFEHGNVGGKETWIPSGESVEKFSVEGTSNKLSFQVVGSDKYNPVLVDISGKIVKTDAFNDLQGMSGKDLASQLHAALISEYAVGGENEDCCLLMSALNSISES